MQNAIPTVKHLAAARESEVLKLWQGLGYYSRARNLHHAAKEIVKKHKGKFPQTWEEVRALKGVGDYTAAAILSFAFDKKYPVVDGNVYRLLSRYLGIETPINSSKAKKEFYETALQLMDNHAPHDFNQAIMEFGALVCKPSNPDCTSCPLNHSCTAFATGTVKQLPVKIKKQKIRSRYFHYLVIEHNNKTWLRKRTEKDIWKNLYDFPMIETPKKISSLKLFQSEEWKKLFGKRKVHIIKESKNYLHKLSHQTLHARFFHVKVKEGFKIEGNNIKAVNSKDIQRFALPRLIERYLEERV